MTTFADVEPHGYQLHPVTTPTWGDRWELHLHGVILGDGATVDEMQEYAVEHYEETHPECPACGTDGSCRECVEWGRGGDG